MEIFLVVFLEGIAVGFILDVHCRSGNAPLSVCRAGRNRAKRSDRVTLRVINLVLYIAEAGASSTILITFAVESHNLERDS